MDNTVHFVHTYLLDSNLSIAWHWQKISYAFKFQATTFLFLSPFVRHTWFHKLANHVKELFPWHWKLTQTFFEYFLVFFLGVLVRCFWDFVHVNLLLLCLEFCKKFWVFISGKCCGSLSKFNIYFLQSLHSHLFFCKCIFLRCYLIQSEPLILYLYNGIQE